MPPSFIARSSRSNSGFSTAVPNHHQRTMILLSAGGLANSCHSAARFEGAPLCPCSHRPAAAKRTEGKKKDTRIAFMLVARKRSRVVLFGSDTAVLEWQTEV